MAQGTWTLSRMAWGQILAGSYWLCDFVQLTSPLCAPVSPSRQWGGPVSVSRARFLKTGTARVWGWMILYCGGAFLG